MLGLGACAGKPEGTSERVFGRVKAAAEGRRSEKGEEHPVLMEGQEVEETVRDVLVANLEEELVGLLEFHAEPQEAPLGSAADSTAELAEGLVSV